MTKNIVFMISIVKDERSKNQKQHYSVKSWSDWCEKNDCELFLLSEDIMNPPQWNKMLVFDLLEGSEVDYDRVLYVDADTIVHPEMPNIFEEFEEGYFYGVRNYGSMDWVCRSIENYSHYLFEGHQLDWEKYINSGMMLFDKSHKEFFRKVQMFYTENKNKIQEVQKLGVGKDQPVLNFMLDIEQVPRKMLPYEYNMQDMMRFEVVGDDLLFTRFGWIYHFNAGVRPTPGAWIEHTYKKLKEQYG
jgi:lipopolysaccharide biosynthesis glycosyltransferase